ncbi:hypothetical protein HDU91_004721 [Kappamyces sp. JEL0680]|nr:hypothetical protein HDU91_004721 [Kappamyces sp. JEL0680]
MSKERQHNPKSAPDLESAIPAPLAKEVSLSSSDLLNALPMPRRIKKYFVAMLLLLAIWSALGPTGIWTMTLSFCKSFLAGPPPMVYTKKAVLVEPHHRLNAIAFSLENALEMLSDEWQVVAVMPNKSEAFIRDLCSRGKNQKHCQSNRLVYSLLPEQDWGDHGIYAGSHWRNKLLLNATWWASLEAEWVLGIQSDTVICRHEDPPLVYNYYGGPSSDTKNVSDLFGGHLNGGFSIRNVQWTISCIERNLKLSEERTEDNVFSRCYAEDKVFYPYHEIAAFASDNGWSGCVDVPGKNRTCPYAVHKPWSRLRLNSEQFQEMLEACPPARALVSYFI